MLDAEVLCYAACRDWKADYLAWRRDTGFSFCFTHGCVLPCDAATASITPVCVWVPYRLHTLP